MTFRFVNPKVWDRVLTIVDGRHRVILQASNEDEYHLWVQQMLKRGARAVDSQLEQSVPLAKHFISSLSEMDRKEMRLEDETPPEQQRKKSVDKDPSVALPPPLPPPVENDDAEIEI